MPYVKRDKHHQIIDVYESAQAESDEFLAIHDAEVVEFLNSQQGKKQIFKQSDAEMIRVIDDLVDVLTENNIIRFTDLPAAAQQKLLNRRDLRKDQNDLLVDDEDEGIF